jgi:hypothetical protein
VTTPDSQSLHCNPKEPVNSFMILFFSSC